MLITFTRNRLRSIIEAIDLGRYIACPKEGEQWEDNELLALAGVCMSQLMFRREDEHRETTDEPLRCDEHRAFGRLSSRMTAALNYALTVASNITNGCVSCSTESPDKTYRVEVWYDGPHYQYMKLKASDLESDEVSEDDEPSQSEAASDREAVVSQA